MINIQSLLQVVPTLLEAQSFILTYKFSQDHLELFFSAVRRAGKFGSLTPLHHLYKFIFQGGFNNNPTCRQFSAIFRKLIAHSGVSPSQCANVNSIDTTQTLRVSEPLDSSPSPFEASQHGDFEPASVDVVVGDLSLFLQNIVAYIAGFVVRKVMERVSCETCRTALIRSAEEDPHQPDELYQLIKLKNEGGLVTPSRGVVSILTTTEKGMRGLMDVSSAVDICSKEQVLMHVKRQCGGSDPLNLGSHISESQEGIDNHFFDLLKLLVISYYNIRQHHVARLHGSACREQPIRQKLTKLILFKGH